MVQGSVTRCDRTPAWDRLRAHFERAGACFDLRQAFASDGQRFERLSQQAPHVFADLSKNLIDATTQALLLELAEQCGLLAHRAAMFAGERINSTEQRKVMHFLLRQPPDGSALARWPEELGSTQATLEAMLSYAEEIRRDTCLTDVVHIGIGGSDLGPCMAVQALEEFRLAGKRFHFVSNVDGHQIDSVLSGLQARRTLFLVASKTFTTTETMANARTARQWFEAQIGEGADALMPRHFVALTANRQAAAEWGAGACFGLEDWVGGRYSLMSAIGLPVAMAVGATAWRELLAGAHAMDEHFLLAPLAQNLPVRLGLLDVWYRNFHGFASRCIAPYHSALARWPAYLQQLEMESNGKRVDRQGQALPFETAPVIWGEPGTNGQHAFFQLLHQGSSVVPVEFLVVRQPAHDWPEHQSQLLANALAQAQALMIGRADSGGHRHFPGNRPSTVMMLERLDPASLGALIALHEHRVFTSGSIWGLNSFDQWGVELGKVLAMDLHKRLQSRDVADLDASTAGLVLRLRQ
jgi:glucose-6-phosphate isomerase